MKLSLIITTYNWPQSLMLVIESIRYQTILPDEIIIADDGSDNQTKDVISYFNKEFSMNLIHSWQQNKGFRVSRSRNRAIIKSSADYIILIDGDVILHSNFVEDHIKNAQPGYFVQGSRVLLSEKITKKTILSKNINFSFMSLGLKNRKNAIHSKILSLIFSTKKNHLNGIKTCNMAFYRKDCIKINGFNNDFEGWGREDSEFVLRLINSGIVRKSVRFNLIQFHLWHGVNSRGSLEKNDEILNNSIKKNIHWCENGINSVLKNED